MLLLDSNMPARALHSVEENEEEQRSFRFAHFA